MANKHVNRCSVILEMQIKTSVRFCLSTTEMAQIPVSMKVGFTLVLPPTSTSHTRFQKKGTFETHN